MSPSQTHGRLDKDTELVRDECLICLAQHCSIVPAQVTYPRLLLSMSGGIKLCIARLVRNLSAPCFMSECKHARTWPEVRLWAGMANYR